LVDP
jgi:hypothetical protein